jgi:glycerophosphoryl diester phosphodiesterase
MAAADGQKKASKEDAPTYRRIGHKGADSISPGNTIESFVAAVEHGVDMVELDVLKGREGRLVVAHDSQDALRRRPLDLVDALDAFNEKPLDEVEIDCDLKLPGREAELAGALAGHDLLERAMVSTMEVESLMKLRQLEPDLRLGWTYPRTRRDWTRYRLASPALATAIRAIRRRFPNTLTTQAPALGVDAVWAYHQIISPRLVEAAEQVGIELIAWTVDDAERMRNLLAMGVHGICSNDPRLFEQVEREPRPASELAKAKEADQEPKPGRFQRFSAKREARKAEKEAKKAEKEKSAEEAASAS